MAAAPAAGPRYPAVDPGLEVLSADQLLVANGDLVTRLRTHSAVGPDLFETRFLAPMRRLADHVGVIPATAAGLFSGEGGLIRAGYESAFFSFQASDGRIFTGSAGVEKRHALEGRWRYLCFLAGLLYPVGKTLERVVVTGADGRPWQRHYGGIGQWARASAVQRIYMSWATATDDEPVGPGNAGLVLAPSVIGPENLQYLEDGAADLVSALYQIVLGNVGNSPIAHHVISSTWERVARREAARRPQAFGRAVTGTHMGPWLAGALQAQVNNGRWKVNSGPLRADSGGLYLLWPDAALDLIAHGAQQDLPGWPSDAPTLAHLLAAAGIVEQRANDLSYVEVIDSTGEILKALKVVNPLAVLEDFNPADFRTPEALDVALKQDPLAPPAPPPPAAARPKAERPPKAERTATPAEAPGTDAMEGADAGDSAPKDSTGSQLKPPAPPPEAPVPSTPPPLKLVEPPEVRFSDLVPEDVRKDIRNPMHAEILGKILKLWRDKPADHAQMWRSPNGAAFAVAFLTNHVRDLPGWAASMGEAGLIYTPPATPGAKVHKATPPGATKGIDVIVLSDRACRKMGL